MKRKQWITRILFLALILGMMPNTEVSAGKKVSLSNKKITIPTSLDVTKNVALTFLACDGNQLTSLDVTKNAALEELFCDENVTVTGYSG